MNSKEYWYAWYPVIFENAILELTDMQELWYRRMIDFYMISREPLPDSINALAKIAKANAVNDLDALSMLRAFFVQKNGKLYNKFCDEQLDIQDKRSKRRSQIAKKAANSRHQKNKKNQEDACIEHSSSNASPMHNDATGQDRTGQDKDRKKGNLNKHSTIKLSSVGSLFPENEKPQKKPKPTRLPDDWEPDVQLGHWAMVKGLTREEVLNEIEAFQNYWKSSAQKAALKLDWDAAFRTWVLNAVKYKLERARS